LKSRGAIEFLTPRSIPPTIRGLTQLRADCSRHGADRHVLQSHARGGDGEDALPHAHHQVHLQVREMTNELPRAADPDSSATIGE